MARRDDRFYVQLTLDVLSPTGKLAGANPAAKWLWAAGLIVSRRDLTDGVIRPVSAAAEAEVPLRHSKELIRRGAWHEPGHGCGKCGQPPAGLVVIHDYAEHNQTRADVETLKSKRREAGKKGADARWNGNGDSKPHGKSHSTAHGKQGGKPMAESESESEPLVTGPSRLTVVVGGLSDDDLDRIGEATSGDRAHAANVARDILARSAQLPRDPLAYILRAIGQEPDRYRQSRRPPRRSEECPTHAGQWADACAGCAADRKASA